MHGSENMKLICYCLETHQTHSGDKLAEIILILFE